jgi:hypothetical protein
MKIDRYKKAMFELCDIIQRMPDNEERRKLQAIALEINAGMYEFVSECIEEVGDEVGECTGR